jgi:F-type H+-transporting ATPase subunit c
MDAEVAKLFAASIAALPLFAVALAMGKLFSALLTAIGRNPGSANAMTLYTFVAAAFTEAVGLFAFVISILILNA